MAVININLNQNWLYDSGDTVTYFTTTFTGSNSIQKTDVLAMDVIINAGTTMTFNNTSYMDVQGSRGAFVDHDTNGVKVRASWVRIEIASTSNLWRIKWCSFSNGTGIVRMNTGSSFATGTFRYNIIFNTSNLLDVVSATGTQFVEDCAFIKALGVSKQNASTTTFKRLTILNSATSLIGVISKTCLMEDIHVVDVTDLALKPSSGEIITVTRYVRNNPGNTNIIWTPASGGVINPTDCQFKGGGITWRSNGAGEVNFVTSDFGDNENLQVGILASGAVGLTSCCIYGSQGADNSVIDTSTNLPNSDSTPAQYSGLDSNTTPAASRNFEVGVTSIVTNVTVDNTFNVTFTTGIRAKAKVLLTKVSGDYSDAVVIASDYDAKGITWKGRKIEDYVTDWNISGKKYSFSHDITIPNLAAGDYFFKIQIMSNLDEPFETAEQSSVAIIAAGGADVTDPTWDDGGPGTDSGLVATDATTNGEVNLSWNTPLDETDVEGVQVFFSTVSGAQAITDGVKRIIPSNITSIRLGGLTNDTEHFFIVRALDKAGNTTSETTGITATPTAISVASPTPGALQAFLTAE